MFRLDENSLLASHVTFFVSVCAGAVGGVAMPLPEISRRRALRGTLAVSAAARRAEIPRRVRRPAFRP